MKNADIAAVCGSTDNSSAVDGSADAFA